MEQELSDKPFDESYTLYSISFDGKNFVHLKFTDFLKSNVEDRINYFRTLSQSPIIEVQCGAKSLDLVAVDKLAPNESWENRLRLHHALGKAFFEKGNPTFAYESFHFGLLLETFNIEEFNNAWIAESVEMGSLDLRERLSRSPDHIKLFRVGGTHGYFFKRTPFVQEQLRIAAEKRRTLEVAAATAKKLEEAAKAQAKAQATKERDEAAAKFRSERFGNLLNAKPSQPAYTIILSPGSVGHVLLKDFFEAGVENWVQVIKNRTATPVIKSPKLNSWGELNLELLDSLFPELPWAERLRLHYRFGRLNIEQGVPTAVYCEFHLSLGLEKLELDACLEAWVKEAWKDRDVAESYLDSPDHFVTKWPHFVFVKTPFVIKHLVALEKQQRENEMANRVLAEQERLQKSRFNTFVYVMEDLRNGLFKIGRSVTPEKRERTLQSEVPQTQMRISIPAEERHEKELHEKFSKKRVRGEWFSLDADDLVCMVSFLKQNGDVDRVSLDSEWFGKISFQANLTPPRR